MRRLVPGWRRFNSEDQGGPELSHVMILALVSIPLIIALMVFGQWVYKQFDLWLNRFN